MSTKSSPDTPSSFLRLASLFPAGYEQEQDATMG
jgi:hypothetical protein